MCAAASQTDCVKRGFFVAMVCGATALTFAVPALASELTNHEPGALVSRATSLVSQTPQHNDAGEADQEANDDATDETSDAPDRAARHSFDKEGKANRKSHDRGNADQGRQGHGPPAWSHAHNHNGHSSPATWKTLTPSQRRNRMAALTPEHTAAMRRWAECTSAGRADCVRPVPPGLAKRG